MSIWWYTLKVYWIENIQVCVTLKFAKPPLDKNFILKNYLFFIYSTFFFKTKTWNAVFRVVNHCLKYTQLSALQKYFLWFFFAGDKCSPRMSHCDFRVWIGGKKKWLLNGERCERDDLNSLICFLAERVKLLYRHSIFSNVFIRAH